LRSSILPGVRPSVLALSALILAAPLKSAQNPQPARIDVMAVADITTQTEDYAEARRQFRTKLLQRGPAPHQEDCKDSKPPVGVAEVYYPSGELHLRAWLSRPSPEARKQYPSVLVVHGGFCFDLSDWEQTQVVRDAGFIVMLPNRRRENGQPGNYTPFYDEVDDVVNAAEYLRRQSYIDHDKIYIVGGSTGGTLTMLAAMTYPHFRAAASFSGSPDAVGYTRHLVASGHEADVPFNYREPKELQLRSAKSYPTSFKCPTRLYYGTEENHFALSTQPLAKLAREHGLDVQAVAVEGGHSSAAEAEMQLAIDFFRKAQY
jgi:dienelactone hydrolase